MQIVVAGMHRSGTSAATRLVNLMGVWAGGEDKFHEADDANPKGYWEHRDVHACNEALLAALDRSWYWIDGLDDPEPLEPPESVARELSQRRRCVIQGLDAHRPWVVKDPRLSLLLRAWLPSLERPVVVIPYRHPAAVARSLARRDRMPEAYARRLWKRYLRASVAQSGGLPRILVRYERLLASPMAEVERLYASLRDAGVRGLRLPDAEQVLAFVNRELDHAGRLDAETSELEPDVAAWWRALEQGDLDQLVSLAGEEVAPSEGEDWGEERHRREQAERRAHRLEKERDALATEVGEDRRIRELHGRLQVQEERIFDLRSQLGSASLRVADLEERLGVQTRRVGELEEAWSRATARAENAEQRADRAAHERAEALESARSLDRLLADLLDSRSFRLGAAVTGSLRALVLRSGRAGEVREARRALRSRLDQLSEDDD